MIELKAELMKKRQAYESERGQVSDSKKRLNLDRSAVKTSKLESSQSDKCSEIKSKSAVELDELEKSKTALDLKARLYNKLQHGKLLESDLSAGQREGLMVDFAWKGWNAETNDFDFKPIEDDDNDDILVATSSSHTETPSSSDPTKRTILTYEAVLNLPDSSSKSWIEYEDEFGRIRLIRSSDLKKLRDERREIMEKLNVNINTNYKSSNHYDGDMEIRNKGVGFFSFARDEEERSRQMKALRKLRSETLESRSRSFLLKEQRRLQLERRLVKYKERKCKSASNQQQQQEQ